jgi:hypothetical protein
MAKAHETEKTKRPLSPGELAARQAAMAPKIATENVAQRAIRARRPIPPTMVDYDRDGYPDSIVGRSGRNFRRPALYNGPGGRARGHLNLGIDTYRQDQIGYRDRLRSRSAAVAAIAAAVEDDEPVDPQLRAMARTGIPSHGSTGIPGGTPTIKVARYTGTLAGRFRRLTPREQSQIAPLTARSKRGQVLSANNEVVVPTSAPGTLPDGTVRRSSYGSVPPRGTVQPDGSFLLTAPALADEPAKAKDSAKPAEHAKSAEHAKPAEHHAKPAEHTKPPEHHTKPAEHTKPPEHHTKPSEHDKK